MNREMSYWAILQVSWCTRMTGMVWSLVIPSRVQSTVIPSKEGRQEKMTAILRN